MGKKLSFLSFVYVLSINILLSFVNYVFTLLHNLTHPEELTTKFTMFL